MTYFEVVLLSFIEGVTEFLPISSTGHLIIAANLFGIHKNEFVISFNIIIQFGAILSVLVLYWRRFLQSFLIYKNLFIAMLPVAVLGLLVKDTINLVLSSPLIVACGFIVGGVVLIWSDKYFANEQSGQSVDKLKPKNSLLIGVIQCCAFIPGVSRAASAILGGLFVGLSRKEATEFSFFLAVPTLAGAALIKFSEVLPTITQEQIGLLSLGLVCSFIFAILAIRFLLGVVSRFGFKYFGYYRIVLGIIIIGFQMRP